jgi:hypothetical protein
MLISPGITAYSYRVASTSLATAVHSGNWVGASGVSPQFPPGLPFPFPFPWPFLLELLPIAVGLLRWGLGLRSLWEAWPRRCGLLTLPILLLPRILLSRHGPPFTKSISWLLQKLNQLDLACLGKQESRTRDIVLRSVRLTHPGILEEELATLWLIGITEGPPNNLRSILKLNKDPLAPFLVERICPYVYARGTSG